MVIDTERWPSVKWISIVSETGARVTQNLPLM
jgi:hypothetical protein